MSQQPETPVSGYLTNSFGPCGHLCSHGHSRPYTNTYTHSRTANRTLPWDPHQQREAVERLQLSRPAHALTCPCGCPSGKAAEKIRQWGEVGRLEWGMDPIFLLLSGREKLGADTLEWLPLPFPGGRQTCLGSILNGGIVPRATWHLYTHVRAPFQPLPIFPFPSADSHYH